MPVIYIQDEDQHAAELLAKDNQDNASRFSDNELLTASELTLIAHTDDERDNIGGQKPVDIAKDLKKKYGANKANLTDLYLISCEAGMPKGKPPMQDEHIAAALARELHNKGFANVIVHAITHPENIENNAMRVEVCTNAGVARLYGQREGAVGGYCYGNAESVAVDEAIERLTMQISALSGFKISREAGKSATEIETEDAFNTYFEINKDKLSEETISYLKEFKRTLGSKENCYNATDKRLQQLRQDKSQKESEKQSEKYKKIPLVKTGASYKEVMKQPHNSYNKDGQSKVNFDWRIPAITNLENAIKNLLEKGYPEEHKNITYAKATIKGLYAQGVVSSLEDAVKFIETYKGPGETERTDREIKNSDYCKEVVSNIMNQMMYVAAKKIENLNQHIKLALEKFNDAMLKATYAEKRKIITICSKLLELDKDVSMKQLIKVIDDSVTSQDKKTSSFYITIVTPICESLTKAPQEAKTARAKVPVSPTTPASKSSMFAPQSSLLSKLDKYIDTRDQEKPTFNSIMLRMPIISSILLLFLGKAQFRSKNKYVKISAATKLRNYLGEGSQEQLKLTDAEIYALKDGRLGKIAKKEIEGMLRDDKITIDMSSQEPKIRRP